MPAVSRSETAFAPLPRPAPRAPAPAPAPAARNIAAAELPIAAAPVAIVASELSPAESGESAVASAYGHPAAVEPVAPESIDVVIDRPAVEVLAPLAPAVLDAAVETTVMPVQTVWMPTPEAQPEVVEQRIRPEIVPAPAPETVPLLPEVAVALAPAIEAIAPPEAVGSVTASTGQSDIDDPAPPASASADKD
jgi:hypothetical protein